jgi:hypothetical protein
VEEKPIIFISPRIMRRYAKGPATAKSIPAHESFMHAPKNLPNRQNALPLAVQFLRGFLADR